MSAIRVGPYHTVQSLFNREKGVIFVRNLTLGGVIGEMF